MFHSVAITMFQKKLNHYEKRLWFRALGKLVLQAAVEILKRSLRSKVGVTAMYTYIPPLPQNEDCLEPQRKLRKRQEEVGLYRYRF